MPDVQKCGKSVFVSHSLIRTCQHKYFQSGYKKYYVDLYLGVVFSLWDMKYRCNKGSGRSRVNRLLKHMGKLIVVLSCEKRTFLYIAIDKSMFSISPSIRYKFVQVIKKFLPLQFYRTKYKKRVAGINRQTGTLYNPYSFRFVWPFNMWQQIHYNMKLDFEYIFFTMQV